jgi:hypothetical protein
MIQMTLESYNFCASWQRKLNERFALRNLYHSQYISDEFLNKVNFLYIFIFLHCRLNQTAIPDIKKLCFGLL